MVNAFNKNKETDVIYRSKWQEMLTANGKVISTHQSMVKDAIVWMDTSYRMDNLIVSYLIQAHLKKNNKITQSLLESVIAYIESYAAYTLLGGYVSNC